MDSAEPVRIGIVVDQCHGILSLPLPLAKIFPPCQPDKISDDSCSDCRLKSKQEALNFPACRFPNKISPGLIVRMKGSNYIFCLSVRPFKISAVAYKKRNSGNDDERKN